MIKYHQKSSNSCCLSSLASSFHIIGDGRAENALVNLIGESLTLHTYTFRNRIHFDYAIMTNILHIKVEHCLRYNLKVWHKNDCFLYTKEHGLICFFGAVNGLTRKCGSCYQYSRVLDI